MSRIHEAIRRAEQERAANHTAQKVEEPLERVASGVIEPAVASIVPAMPVLQPVIPQSIAGVLPGTLNFEDVWANCCRPICKPNSNLLVFSNTDPFHAGTEQFRTLRSRLYRMRENQPLHTILISSAIPAEGKTLVAANLANALVRQQGCRVLLIDADLRSPRIHLMLGAPEVPGLAELLQNAASEMEVIQRGHEEGLCFIAAGKNVAHPSELISSDRMKQLLEHVKPAFDWIIIDSPPALPVADASVLGGLCDGVLFVVRANSTPSETAQKACKELRDAHILGVVLNTAEEDLQYGSYYSTNSYGVPIDRSHKK